MLCLQSRFWYMIFSKMKAHFKGICSVTKYSKPQFYIILDFVQIRQNIEVLILQLKLSVWGLNVHNCANKHLFTCSHALNYRTLFSITISATEIYLLGCMDISLPVFMDQKQATSSTRVSVACMKTKWFVPNKEIFGTQWKVLSLAMRPDILAT